MQQLLRAVGRLYRESSDASLSAPRRGRSAAELQRCLTDERVAVVAATCAALRDSVECGATERSDVVQWIEDALRIVPSDSGGDHRRAVLVHCAAQLAGASGLVAALRVCPQSVGEAVVEELGAVLGAPETLRDAPALVAFVLCAPGVAAGAKMSVADAALDAAEAGKTLGAVERSRCVARIAGAALRYAPLSSRPWRAATLRTVRRAARVLRGAQLQHHARDALLELRDCIVARIGRLLQCGVSALGMLQCVANLTDTLRRDAAATRETSPQLPPSSALARRSRAGSASALLELGFAALFCATPDEAATIAAIARVALASGSADEWAALGGPRRVAFGALILPLLAVGGGADADAAAAVLRGADRIAAHAVEVPDAARAVTSGRVAALSACALAQFDARGARVWLDGVVTACERTRAQRSDREPRSAQAVHLDCALIFVAAGALAHSSAAVRRSAGTALTALCRAPSPQRSTHALWALPTLLSAIQRETDARTQHALLTNLPALAHSTSSSAAQCRAVGSVALDSSATLTKAIARVLAGLDAAATSTRRGASRAAVPAIRLFTRLWQHDRRAFSILRRHLHVTPSMSAPNLAAVALSAAEVASERPAQAVDLIPVLLALVRHGHARSCGGGPAATAVDTLRALVECGEITPREARVAARDALGCAKSDPSVPQAVEAALLQLDAARPLASERSSELEVDRSVNAARTLLGSVHAAHGRARYVVADALLSTLAQYSAAVLEEALGEDEAYRWRTVARIATEHCARSRESESAAITGGAAEFFARLAEPECALHHEWRRGTLGRGASAPAQQQRSQSVMGAAPFPQTISGRTNALVARWGRLQCAGEERSAELSAVSVALIATWRSRQRGESAIVESSAAASLLVRTSKPIGGYTSSITERVAALHSLRILAQAWACFASNAAATAASSGNSDAMFDALAALLEGLLGDDEVATACSACLALGGVLAASAPKSKRCARRFTRLFSSLTLMVANVSKHTDEPQRAVAAAAAFALGVALRGAVSNGERARSVGPLLDAAVSVLKGAAATRGAGTRLASCATLALGLLCEGIASAPVSTSESLGLLAQAAEGLCSAAAECVLSGTDATQFASAASIVVASINNAGAGEEAARVVERLRVLSLSIDMRALAAADLDAELISIGVAASTAQVFAAAAPAMDGMSEYLKSVGAAAAAPGPQVREHSGAGTLSSVASMIAIGGLACALGKVAAPQSGADAALRFLQVLGELGLKRGGVYGAAWPAIVAAALTAGTIDNTEAKRTVGGLAAKVNDATASAAKTFSDAADPTLRGAAWTVCTFAQAVNSMPGLPSPVVDAGMKKLARMLEGGLGEAAAFGLASFAGGDAGAVGWVQRRTDPSATTRAGAAQSSLSTVDDAAAAAAAAERPNATAMVAAAAWLHAAVESRHVQVSIVRAMDTPAAPPPYSPPAMALLSAPADAPMVRILCQHASKACSKLGGSEPDSGDAADARRALEVTLGALARCAALPPSSYDAFFESCISVDSGTALMCVEMALAHCEKNASALAFLASCVAMRADVVVDEEKGEDALRNVLVDATPRLVHARIALFHRIRHAEQEKVKAMSEEYREKVGSVRNEEAAGDAARDVVELCALALSQRCACGSSDVAVHTATSDGADVFVRAAVALGASIARSIVAAEAEPELELIFTALQDAVLSRFVVPTASAAAPLKGLHAVACGFSRAAKPSKQKQSDPTGLFSHARVCDFALLASKHVSLDASGRIALQSCFLDQGILAPHTSFSTVAMLYREVARCESSNAPKLLSTVAAAVAGATHQLSTRSERRAFKWRWVLECFEAILSESTSGTAVSTTALELMARLSLMWCATDEAGGAAAEEVEFSPGCGEPLHAHLASLPTTCVPHLGWSLPGLVTSCAWEGASVKKVHAQLLAVLGCGGVAALEWRDAISAAALAIAQLHSEDATVLHSRCAAREEGAL